MLGYEININDSNRWQFYLCCLVALDMLLCGGMVLSIMHGPDPWIVFVLYALYWTVTLVILCLVLKYYELVPRRIPAE